MFSTRSIELQVACLQRNAFALGSGEPNKDDATFNRPNGVASTTTGETVVADTNNHRSDGSFKLCFGGAGPENARLLT